VSTRQAPFEGSARQARGRVLRALHDGARPRAEFPADIVESLLADRLVTEHGDLLALP
jgi:A/G-specific adenine glycosylase